VNLSIWVWLVILLVVGLLAFLVVSPAKNEEDTGEPPSPGAG
jgi:hypothetical protein